MAIGHADESTLGKGKFQKALSSQRSPAPAGAHEDAARITMKYKVTVNNQVYEVEIENINARPVIAHVDGERFEIMPENAGQAETRKESSAIKEKAEKKSFAPSPAPAITPSPNPALSGNALTAPLPGTVIEVFVKPGGKVEAGQVVVIIEAMKMKNSIRSVYSGTISEVLVSAGQSVAHKQALVKFADLGEASWM
jgi:biotin carboxyl carrier protein